MTTISSTSKSPTVKNLNKHHLLLSTSPDATPFFSRSRSFAFWIVKNRKSCKNLAKLANFRKSTMGLDYYKPLFLERGATEAEVKQAYKKMALLHHPTRVRVERPVTPSLRAREQILRDQRRQMDSFQMFHIVGEAYDVLGDPMRRAIFDLYGERGLKEGLQGPDGFIPPYAYHGDPHKTFRDFFGTDNPFIDLLADACVPVDYFAGNNVDGSKVKEPPIYRDLWLDLEEFYTGCVKKVMICKKVLTGEGKKTEFQEKVLTIPVKPGTPNGAKFSFPNEGDESLDVQAPDIVFITRERKHPIFHRQENNLILEHEVHLCGALTGHVIHVTSLDQRQFNVAVVHIIRPGYEKVIPGEGFPIYGEPNKRGDLIIKFQVNFPNTLTQAQKKATKVGLDCGPGNPPTGLDCYSKRLPVSMTYPVGCMCPFEPDAEVSAAQKSFESHALDPI